MRTRKQENITDMMELETSLRKTAEDTGVLSRASESPHYELDYLPSIGTKANATAHYILQLLPRHVNIVLLIQADGITQQLLKNLEREEKTDDS
jgi:hypothetical protein